MQGWIIISYCLLLLGSVHVVANDSALDAKPMLVSLGIIGLWRYGWQALNVLRALYYRHRIYPRWRARLNQAPCPPVYLIVCSYQTPWAISEQMLAKLAAAIRAYAAPVTVFLAVTDVDESRRMESALLDAGLPDSCRLWLFAQNGCGKRAAIAAGLKRIAQEATPVHSVTVLMDGDVLLSPDILTRSVVALDPDKGVEAVTVHNRALCAVQPWLQVWYDLRLAQRHVLMNAQSLSNRLLVLTGRFSAYRTTGVTQPDFIHTMEDDSHFHWQYGRLRLLTGDDKTAWYVALQKGWRMRYLPDVSITALESPPPASGFIQATLRLQHRWYGNSFRANGIALRLGWRSMPFYTRWSLIDQRLSMWTSLLGPVAVLILLIVLEDIKVVAAYALWVLLTRSVYSLILGSIDGRWHAGYPVLLYYNQIVGSLVKIFCFFHRYQQRWTRQSFQGEQALWQSPIRAYVPLGAMLWQFNACLLFICGVIWLVI